jgi:transcriptional regulator with XRE-family HTH domain
VRATLICPVKITGSMSSVAEIFGTALRRIRTERGITQKQLGAMTGISHTFIGEMERGRKAPNLDAVVALAAALNARIDELLSDFSPKPPIPRQPGAAIAAARLHTTRIGARLRKRQRE